MTLNKKKFFIGGTILMVFAGTIFFYFPYTKKNKQLNENNSLTEAHYIGSPACSNCHQQETELWKNSDHHRAMEEANPTTVLGNFNNATFNYFGRKTVFLKRDGQFLVKTENQQGLLETFTVTHTLGYKPLQQYLVKFADGRIQTLPFAWDTRPQSQGGQRWFHLYPNDNIKADNPLFWTRPLQNWNHMCADCHTTNYAKNFSDEKNTFASHWSEIGNGCESCHGAGSAHAELMSGKNPPTKMLLINKLTTQSAQIDQCGVCHARRERLKEEPSHEKILQSWQPELLQNNLYFTDGQMHDEVFNIGSFMQSKMYNANVTCTNCHNPHSNKLTIEGNGLCTQCHIKENYDTDKHHFHGPDSAGGKCVNCHMPTQTYMVVDTRHDHQFSVPRPDLSEQLGVSSGVPNTCVSCHQGQMQQKSKNNAWAAGVISKHLLAHGKSEQRAEHFATAFWQARHQQVAAVASLKKLVTDNNTASIVKATAMLELANYLNPDTLVLVQANLNSSDALVRFGAVQALSAAPLEQRSSLLASKLTDPSRAVRFAMAPLLADTDKNRMTSAQQKQLEQLFAEYKAWLLSDSDRGNALANLANFLLMQGDVASAKVYFDKALQRDDKSLSVLLNYADYYRSQGNDVQAEKLLRTALVIYPDSADAHYALGLLLVRAKNYPAALTQLKQARSLAPLNSHYAYVYAIGLYSNGAIETAISTLADASAQFPANSQITSALQAYCMEQQTARATSSVIARACQPESE